MTGDTTGVPRVYAAIDAITKAMARDGIAKDRKNEQQRYNFRGIDDVLNALSTLYAEHHIFVLPAYGNRTATERETKTGGALFNVVLEGTYRIKSALDGSEVASGPFIGEAMDSADKATNKAMSAAYKYFAIQTFSIPTEGDNDADATTHEPAPRRASTPQVELPPDTNGFGAWADDMETIALEGVAALMSAFNASKPEYKNKMTGQHKARWNAMREKAAAVRKAS